jgi:hypothetical protein
MEQIPAYHPIGWFPGDMGLVFILAIIVCAGIRLLSKTIKW